MNRYAPNPKMGNMDLKKTTLIESGGLCDGGKFVDYRG